MWAVCGSFELDWARNGGPGAWKRKKGERLSPCVPLASGSALSALLPGFGHPHHVHRLLRTDAALPPLPLVARYEARLLPEVVSRGAPQQQQQQQQHAADAPHTQRQQQRREQGEREHYSTRYMAADAGVPACDPCLQPSATWTRDFLQQFAWLRRRLHRCRHKPLALAQRMLCIDGLVAHGMHVAVPVLLHHCGLTYACHPACCRLAGSLS